MFIKTFGIALIGIALGCVVSCTKKTNTTVVAPSGYSIGQTTNGGVIFYVYEDSAGTQHALVSATADEAGGAAYNWDAGAVPGSAQNACSTKSVAVAGVTYDDWILPDQDQMTALYNNRYAIDPSDSNGGFSDETTGPNGANYWTATASETSGFAWTQVFSNGGMQDKDVNELRLVRCIRVI